MEKEILEKIIIDEKAGKNLAIHAYDKMVWTVRSGYLTLVFGGWGFVVKSAVETDAKLAHISPYILMLSGFTIALSIGAYLIDRNYARRKFRVIYAVNNLIQLTMNADLNEIDNSTRIKLTELLQISGDADNKNYRFKAFSNEMRVGEIIYLLTSALIICVAINFLIMIKI